MSTAKLLMRAKDRTSKESELSTRYYTHTGAAIPPCMPPATTSAVGSLGPFVTFMGNRSVPLCLPILVDVAA